MQITKSRVSLRRKRPLWHEQPNLRIKLRGFLFAASVGLLASGANAQNTIMIEGKQGNSSAVATGIVVNQGDHLEITAVGVVNWTTPGGSWDGPEGQPNAFFSTMWLPSAERSSLIGQIGSTLFEIDAYWSGSAPDSGELFLGVNDDYYSDNRGAFYVQIGVRDVYLSSDFSQIAGPFVAGNCSTEPVIATGVDQWQVANLRYQNCPSNPGTVDFPGGYARMWSLAYPGNTGGYNGLFREVPELPTEWQLTVDIFVTDVEDPINRPVPHCFVQYLNPDLFPADQDSKGWYSTSGQILALDDGNAVSMTNYEITVGQWHTIELINSSIGSELRAWGPDQERPSLPLVSGDSLGEARRVLFQGPNYKAYDFSIGRVLLKHGPTLVIRDILNGGLSGNQPVEMSIQGATPNSATAFAYSLAGGGPTSSPCGILDLSTPFTQLVQFADPNGTAFKTVGVPASASGLTVWIQGADLVNCTLTDSLEAIIN